MKPQAIKIVLAENSNKMPIPFRRRIRFVKITIYFALHHIFLELTNRRLPSTYSFALRSPGYILTLLGVPCSEKTNCVAPTFEISVWLVVNYQFVTSKTEQKTWF